MQTLLSTVRLGALAFAAKLLLADPLTSAQPGTDDEARDYALREAASPEVQDFVGGDGWFVALLLAAMILVVVILILEDKKKS